MEVPLEHQTKESLIAYIQSLESQAEQDVKRKAALEKEHKHYREALITIASDHPDSDTCQMLPSFARKVLDQVDAMAGKKIDAIAPALQERRVVKPNPRAHNHVDGKTCPQCR